eukprot:PhM_4_TR3045/c4_g4_i1/m.45514/K00632/fadA, fadI; acetyl-CoA acyltransferase
MDRVNVVRSHLKQERAVIVDGARTPFVRGYAELLDVDALGLGVAAVRGLLAKTKLSPAEVNHVIWGNVVAMSAAPNLGKEIAIDVGLPPAVTGHSVSMACASGIVAVLSAAQMIEGGLAGVIVAGGSDSMSCGQLPLDRHVTQSLALYGQGKLTLTAFLKKAGMPWSWMPTTPSISERTTGKTMGQHCDEMCATLGATRAEQDIFAMKSHAKASTAVAAGVNRGEVFPVGKATKDTLIRSKQDPKKLASLKPAFRPLEKGGTVTAANATPVTDGGSAVLVMSESKAKALGYPTDVSIRASAYAGITPTPNLLLAPAHGIHMCLERAGLCLADIDYFEIHEAFAGQVVSTVKCLASQELSKKWLDRDALGVIPEDKINIYGGSLAYGHPFAATGGRMITNAARILRNKKCRYVLVSVCAAGGLGAVVILERTD